MMGCRVSWFACVLVTLLHSYAQNLASSLGSLASFAETAAQLGGAINSVKNARENSVASSSGGGLGGRKNENSETSTSPIFLTPRTDQSGLKEVVGAFNALKECDPNSDGLCCVLRDYCDPNASCYSDVTASNVAEYMNAIPQCECVAGFEGDGTSRGSGCANINECDWIPRVCDQLCMDYAPGYGCGCREGFTLARDNYSCYDVDECQNGIARCSHECLNTEGSYRCLCPSGFQLGADGYTCSDIDECKLRTCEYPDLCENYDGGFSCGCPPGYAPSEIDTRLCVDIDECSFGVILPLAEARMHFTADDFQEFPAENPEAPGGASLSSPVVRVVACPADKGQSCFNFVGGFTCKCQTGYNSVQRYAGGYTSTTQVADDSTAVLSLYAITYRSATDLALYAKTFSVDGSTPVQLRENVYTATEHLNAATRSLCEDIDECVVIKSSPLNLDVCTSEVSFEGVQTATETLKTELEETGIYPSTAQLFCTPKGDYGTVALWSEIAASLQSVSSDQGTNNEPPQCTATEDSTGVQMPVCSNSVGAFECQCVEGYVYDWTLRRCVDIDECAVDRHECSRQTENCVNVAGTYYCECKEGFKMPAVGDSMTCVDIDECTEGSSLCAAECHNTLGAYYCSCPKGLELAEDGYTCTDVDECSSGLCPSACLNTEGSFICACEEGFVDASFVDKRSGAVKVPNAPTNFEWPAAVLEAARDTPAGQLTPEFIGQVRDLARVKFGVRCVDVNECALGNDTCPQGFTCHNVVGSFECRCPPGYTFQEADGGSAVESAGGPPTAVPTPAPATASSTDFIDDRKRGRFAASDSAAGSTGGDAAYGGGGAAYGGGGAAYGGGGAAYGGGGAAYGGSNAAYGGGGAAAAPVGTRGVNQMLGSAIAAMSGQSALLQGMSAVATAAGGSGAGGNRGLSHSGRRSTPVQWGRRPRQLQLMGALQQSWGSNSIGGLSMGGRSGNRKTGRGWIDNDNNSNDSTTGTEMNAVDGAFIFGHDISVDKSRAADWLESHLKLGKHQWRRLAQCLDRDECTLGVEDDDGTAGGPPCAVGGPTPCCHNLEGTYECLKKSGVFASKACPVVNGYRTFVWTPSA